MKELIFICLMYIVISVAFIAAVTLISAPFKAYSCHNYGVLTERKTNYSIFNGCFVEHKGRFIPRSELERRFIMSDKE